MDYEKNSPEYKRAKKRVSELKEFYQHLGTFICVILGLTLLNAFTSGISNGVWWVQWVIFGWGIGLLSHAFSVFGIFNFLGKDWEDKKIQELLQKEK